MSKCPTCGEETDPWKKLGPISKGFVYAITSLVGVLAIVAAAALIVFFVNLLGRIA